MIVNILNNEAGGLKSLEITDGQNVLTMEVRRDRWGTCGDLKAADGSTWGHASVAEINLLILHARAARSVAALIEELGECDEKRLVRKS